MVFDICEADARKGVAFLSNADLQNFDISVSGIKAKDKKSLARLHEMLNILRIANVLPSFFLENITMYPNGIKCQMSKYEDGRETDPFFQYVADREICDYSGEIEPISVEQSQEASADMPQPKTSSAVRNRGKQQMYSDPIVVVNKFSICTNSIDDAIACAIIIKEHCVSSNLYRDEEGGYILSVGLNPAVVEDLDVYVPCWLVITEFAALCDYISSPIGGTLLIKGNAVQKLCAAFEASKKEN